MICFSRFLMYRIWSGGIKTGQCNDFLLDPFPLILRIYPKTALPGVVNSQHKPALAPLSERFSMYRRDSKSSFAVEIQGAGPSKHR